MVKRGVVQEDEERSRYNVQNENDMKYSLHRCPRSLAVIGLPVTLLLFLYPPHPASALLAR